MRHWNWKNVLQNDNTFRYYVLIIMQAFLLHGKMTQFSANLLHARTPVPECTFFS